MANNDIVERIKRSPKTLQAIQDYRKEKGLTGLLTEYDYVLLTHSRHCRHGCDKKLLTEIMILTQQRRLKTAQTVVIIGDAIIPKSQNKLANVTYSIIEALFGN